MKTKSRITSILKANSLDFSVTDWQSFDLSVLELPSDFEFQLPTNKRLGHLAETIVSELIKASTNYKVLYENIQVTEDKKTIGEIDFILKDMVTKQHIHMELAYKFYLYDPHISSEPINNWIGPNRNDSLVEKLEKLKNKQFPLLYHDCTKSALKNIQIEEVAQELCLLVSLFIPYEYKASFGSSYEKAVTGYYLNFETFTSMDHAAKLYYLPSKREWGMDPSENETWNDRKAEEAYIINSLKEKQSILCWQKCENSYSTFFIVWW